MMRWVKILVIVALMTSLVYAVKEMAPIKYVKVGSSFKYITRDEIKYALEPLVNVGFFEADVQKIRDALKELIWVDTVTVSRIWPDTIAVKIYEKRPYVRWGEEALINSRGELIVPKDMSAFSNLPILKGPQGQQLKSLEIMKGVNTALSDQQMDIVQFEINDRWAWKIVLKTGLEILLGRDEQLKKLQRFIKTLDILKSEQVAAMAIVDLRYPNGYSVSWKRDARIVDWKTLPAAQAATR
jgi:cell division protein FtsQ